MHSARSVLRWVFIVLALAYLAWTAPELIHNFREWRGALPGDPVAAGFWRSAFYLDVADIAVVLAVGIIVWFVLRPRKGAGAPSAQG